MANPHPVLANLQPFQPGQSGNPAGRPKNAPVVTPRMRHYAEMPMTALRDLLEQVESGNPPPDMTAADAIALVMIKKAITEVAWGDKAREDVIRRLDGDSTDITVGVQVLIRQYSGFSPEEVE
ncbi:MAG: DUF5681 domain-containing protein [Candidatus Nanopelagicales bacterium]|nr:DUF5681 domain-containing protein [Candidatus Nanopelagicales bacterium]